MYYYWNKSRFFWYMLALIVCASIPVIEEATYSLSGMIREMMERRIRRQIQKEFDKIIRSSN